MVSATPKCRYRRRPQREGAFSLDAHLVGRRDVEDDIGIAARERSELRREHHDRRQRRANEPYAARRPLSKPRDLPYCISDIGQRRIQATDYKSRK
jgi:hypothetical protein